MVMYGKGNSKHLTDSFSEDSRPLIGDQSMMESDMTDTSAPRNTSVIEMQSSAEQEKQSDFVFIKIVARLTLQVLRKFWAFSSAALFAIVLFYWLWGGFVAFALVAFAATGLLYNATDRFLYHPDQPATSRVFVPSPSTFGLPFESLFIRSKDSTRIHLFFIKCPSVTAEISTNLPTILFLHGNAGNMGHRLSNVNGLVKNLGCHVCLVDYRGYGHSDGSPSEDGLYLDAQAALDYLWTRTDIDRSKIVVFGRSLGGAVAIDLCSRMENRDKISCLLLENTFTSIPDVAVTLFNFRIIRMLPKWMYKNQFLSRWKVCKISSPVLFLSGAADALIPSAMMTDLYRACSSEKKRLARFPDGTHNETWMCSHYYHTIAYFIEQVAFKDFRSEENVSAPPSFVVSSTATV